MTTIYPVILSGGSGSRLWPASRRSYPKQLQTLVGEHSLIQNTVLRTQTLNTAPPIILCNEDHRFIISAQLQEIDVTPLALILEPIGRNTAPAAAIAALQLTKIDAGDGLILLLPADHHIGEPENFVEAVHRAIPQAEAGALTTFGIHPDRAETGYGYIRQGDDLGNGVFKIDRFVEKPDAKTAEKYLKDKCYSWNSGMFMFRADRYLEELSEAHPEMVAACQKTLEESQQDLDFIRLDAKAFAMCPSNSIDYAVMEKTSNGVIIPVDMGWSDIGNWSALWELGEKDTSDNFCQGDVMTIDSKNCFVRSDGPLVTTIGVDDVMVIATVDSILVAARDRAQDVKTIVEKLEASGRTEHITHQCVQRPWGTYETIDAGERFQVKHLMVRPGGCLSLQMHHHRAEHWIVVEGTARVTKGDKVTILSENESTYIPVGTKHRLENPGKVPLSLIEVQSGKYLGEDDIVRFEDIYRRGGGQDLKSGTTPKLAKQHGKLNTAA